MSPEERAELDEWVSRLVALPTRAWRGRDFFLIYTCTRPDGPPRMMEWEPDTPESRAKATRYFEAAHCLGEFARAVLPGEIHQRTDDERALIRGIIANRDDDLPLLVYSDWLTEHGSTQGEFIRVTLAMKSYSRDDPARVPYSERWNILAKDAGEWIRPLTDLGIIPSDHCTPMSRHLEWPFLLLGDRGVTEALTIERPGLLPDSAARLFAAAPLLRELKFAYGHLYDSLGLSKLSQFVQIEKLRIDGPIPLSDLMVLTSSEYLTGLRTFALHGSADGDREIAILLRSAVLPRLTSLEIVSGGVTSAGVAKLVGSPAVANLRSLDLTYNPVGADGAAAIAGSRHLANLRELKVHANKVGDKGKSVLLERFGESVVSFR